MAAKSPILPILANVLGLGIPAIAEAVERGKAKRANKQASADAGAAAANGLGSLYAGAGAGIGVMDQIGIGREVMHQLTQVPIEALPDTAPEWVQYAYLGVTVAGIILRFIAAKMATKPLHHGS